MRALNLLRIAAFAAAFATLAPAAFAQKTVTGTVPVSVSLSSLCRWQGGTAPSIAMNFGTYTAFGSATVPAPDSGDLVIECTRNFGAAPAFSWDTGADKADAGSGVANGVLAGLNYSLTVAGPTVAGGTTALPGTPGTAKTVTFKVTGDMPSGQAGDGAGGAASHNRTLTVQF